MDKWISVKDELPEPCEMVIVYTEAGVRTIATAGHDGEFLFPGVGPFPRYNLPTHWMSLPKPPTTQPSQKP